MTASKRFGLQAPVPHHPTLETMMSDPVDVKLAEWFEGRDSELGRFDPALLLEAVKTVSP
jgi:hypothetical protein